MAQILSPGCRIRSLPMDHAGADPLRGRHVVAGLLGSLVGPYQDGAPVPVNHRLVFSMRGRAHLAVEDGPAYIEEGELWLLPAGRPWRYWLEEGEAWEVLWIRMENVDAWEHLRQEQPHRRLEAESKRIHTIMEGFITEAGSSQPDAAQVARLYAGILGAYLDRQLTAHNRILDHTVRHRMEELWKQVEGDLTHHWTSAEMARRIHMSESHLYRVMHTMHHCTPGEMFTNLRIDRAKVLLLASNAKLAEIAEATGFATQFSFSRAFKKHTGTSPGRFRQETARLV